MVRGFFSRLDHGRKIYRERKRLGLCVLNGCNRPLVEGRVKCQFHLDLGRVKKWAISKYIKIGFTKEKDA